MLTEDYNGICPKCNYKRMLVRYGSDGYFQFDACPNCGFAYGTNGDKECHNENVWNGIIIAWRDMLIKEGYKPTRKGVFDMINSWKDPDAPLPSVFQHQRSQRTLLEVCI